jgi:hypothetical protein
LLFSTGLILLLLVVVAVVAEVVAAFDSRIEKIWRALSEVLSEIL